jgi:general secretion pathway protein I
MQRQAGFTLLEVLIAFIIAAVALGALFGGAADGLRASRIALGVEEAVVRARSHLAASAADPLPGDEQGDDGSGFRWRVRIVKVDSVKPPAPAPQPLGQPRPPSLAPLTTLYAITVWISWREAGQVREVRLDSEGLSPPPPRPG